VEARAGLLVVTAAVLAGELTAPTWPALSELAVVPLLATAALWVASGRAGGIRLWLLVGTLGLALGALRMRSIVHPLLAPGDVARLALPQSVTLEGRIARAPAPRSEATVLVVEAERVRRGTTWEPANGLVRVSLRHATRRWRYSDRLRFAARLRQPRNFDNPGRFDWVGHLGRQGIRVITSLAGDDAVVRLPGRTRGVRAWLERWRARLERRIARALPGPEGPILQALVVGQDGAIAPDVREAFTRAGVVHVLSVSGLHIGLVAALAFALVRWLLARSERLLLAVDVDRVAGVVSLGPVALYAALAGLGVATLRSALMAAAAVAAALVARRIDVLRSLTLAALGLAVAWPGSPLEIGFQLSFASVAAIAAGVARLAPGAGRGGGWRTRLRAAALVSPCALLGTAPLTAFHFHQVSIVGLVANPLVVPIFGSAVVALGLVGAVVEPAVPGLTVLLFRAAGMLLRPGIALVDALASPRWAAVDVPIPTLFELGLGYTLLAALLMLPGRARRALVAVALLLGVADAGFWVRERRMADRLRVTFLDVGQGDAAVLELPGGRVLVVDAGGFPGSDFDPGAAVVTPFLLTRKILSVDALAMTHAHPDHFGGLASLILHDRPREFWWTGVRGQGTAWTRLEAVLAARHTRVRVLGAGDPPPGFAAGIRVLHPPTPAAGLSLNDSSLTLRAGLGSVGILLTGDIERRAEVRLAETPEALASLVLKVPHHGSRTSSTPAFLDAVAPRVAVVSVGAENRYRLPAPDVEARYRARGICVLRTDRCGAVTVETDGRNLAVSAMRPECSCPERSARR
jgi:competence protein ComEC